jgi:hypothetical protein
MTNDPMRQADIMRRISNLNKAPRCGARTRAGLPCKQAAVKGRPRCRMHGGAKGSGGPRGDRNGNFKNGRWTRESMEMRRAIRAKVREIKALLQAGDRIGSSCVCVPKAPLKQGEMRANSPQRAKRRSGDWGSWV